MSASLLDQGVTLMLVGMGTVFVFLTILVVAMSALSAFAQRFIRTGVEVSDEEVAAISAAITQHRKTKAI